MHKDRAEYVIIQKLHCGMIATIPRSADPRKLSIIYRPLDDIFVDLSEETAAEIMGTSNMVEFIQRTVNSVERNITK